MRYALCLIALLLFQCTAKVSEDDLLYLNGYWEIEKVIFPDGKTKDYTVNTSIDFIELEGFDGFRKKMQPNLEGGYATSNDAISFQIVQIDENFIMQYSNEQDLWKETLVTLTSNRFSVVNEQNITYFYKRFTPINTYNDG